MSDYRRSKPPRSSVRLLTSYRVWIILVGIAAVLGAVALFFLDEMMMWAMILAIPSSLVLILIMRNPFIGILTYYVYSFLRPYDFIPALAYLKLGILVAGLTFVVWVFYALRDKPPIRWDKFNYVYLAYLFVLGVSAVFAMNNFKAYKIWEAGFTEFIVFVTAMNVIQNRKQLKTLLWTLLLIHGYYVIKGIINYVLYINQLGDHTTGSVGSGFIGDENDFAMAINVMIPIAFFMAFAARRFLPKILLSGLIALFLVGVVLSFSRGGFVGLVVVALFCVWYSRKIVMGLLLTCLAAVMILAFAPDRYVNEVQSISKTDEGTADARIQYWKTAMRMYADHPIIGVGADNGGVHLPAYWRGKGNPNTKWGRVFHGLFPQLFAEVGTVGVAIWLTLFGWMMVLLNRIRRAPPITPRLREYRYLAAGLMVGMLGYVSTSTFLSTAYYPQVWTLYTLSFALVWLFRVEVGDEEALTTGVPVSRQSSLRTGELNAGRLS